MAAVLRKNRAWLQKLINSNLSKVLSSLRSQEIISEDEESISEASTLLDLIMNKMDSKDDPSGFGLNFVQFLLEADIGYKSYLKKTAEEFKEEQERASRRRSTASLVESSGVTVISEKRRGSTGTIETSSRRSRKSSERRSSTCSESSLASRSRSNSESSEFSPLHNKAISVSTEQSQSSNDREAEYKGDALLQLPPQISSISEEKSPSSIKKFGTETPTLERVRISQTESQSLNVASLPEKTLVTPVEDTSPNVFP